MKTIIFKTLMMIIIILFSQVIYAQSYQRWIYWTNEGHQLTAQEMGEITEKLFDRKIIPNKIFTLSNGVSLRIPQPLLFLRYIRVAVLSVRPWATERDQIVDAIYTSDRFRWGNDVNVRVKNYWVSSQNKKTTFTNNYSGEGKGVFFLFVDGIPTIKCDCGNPLELMPEYYSHRHQNGGAPQRVVKPVNPSVLGSGDKISEKPIKEEDSAPFLAPKTVAEMVTGKVPTEQSTDIFLPENKFNWKPVIIIGGTTLAIGTGLLVYSLLKKKKPNDPVIPGSPVDPTGPMDTTGP